MLALVSLCQLTLEMADTEDADRKCVRFVAFYSLLNLALFANYYWLRKLTAPKFILILIPTRRRVV